MEFKFYDNFFDAINLLPEGEREKACYEFCKYGITGELPEDKNLAMFCLGVSVSVQKYQGRGGARQNAGRKSNNQKIQKIQKNQKNQKIHNEQTETITKTETKTETLTEAVAEAKATTPLAENLLLNWYGEYSNVHLTDEQYNQLKCNVVGDKKVLDGLIDELSSNIAQKNPKAPPYDEEYPDMHFSKIKAYWNYRKLHGFKPPDTKEDKALKFKQELDALTAHYRAKELDSG